MSDEDEASESRVVKAVREYLEGLDSQEDQVKRMHREIEETNELLRQVRSEIEDTREQLTDLMRKLPSLFGSYVKWEFDIILFSLLGFILWRVW